MNLFFIKRILKSTKRIAVSIKLLNGNLFLTLVILRIIINDKGPIIIDQNGTANHHMIMNSEASYDTEDWNNDAHNLALNHRIKYNVKLHSIKKTIISNKF